jgi:opacity protein-like surface antigen
MIQKFVLFNLIFTFLPITYFGQNESQPMSKTQAVGFTFSPDYCYRSLKAEGDLQFIVNDRDWFVSPKFGFTAGFNYAIRLSNRFTLETSILYSEKGEKVKFSDLIPSTIINDPANPTKIVGYHHYLYVDLPVKLNFYLRTKKLKFYLTGGVSPNIHLVQKYTWYENYADGHSNRSITYDNNSFSLINLAFTAGVGLSYDLTEKFYLKVEPTYRRSITSIISGPIEGYLYSVGLNTGIYYNF